MGIILFESPSPKIWENNIYGVIFIQIFGPKRSNTLTSAYANNLNKQNYGKDFA